MHNKSFIIGLMISVISCGSTVNNCVRKEVAVDPHQTVKETPDIILEAKLAANDSKDASQLKEELSKKYDLHIANGYPADDTHLILFFKRLLTDEETAKKLAAYKVKYWASDNFKYAGGWVDIDARLTPRQVLEYIQTH